MALLDRYGVVSDEIDGDPSVAFPLARELGLTSLDLNSLWGRPVTDLRPDEVRTVRALAEQNGLRVFLVAGLPFKSLVVEGLSPDALLGAAEFAAHLGVLERSLEIAALLGAPCVRVHGFAWPPQEPGASARRPGGGEIPEAVLPTIAAGLRAACRLAARFDLLLGIENVRASYANGGANLRRVLDAVGDPRLRVVWDPANAYVSGEERPYPDGFAAIAPQVIHVHAKDARLVDAASGATAWECIGAGAVDWAGQLRALEAADYAGALCVETHWKPAGRGRAEATRATLAALRHIHRGVRGGRGVVAG